MKSPAAIISLAVIGLAILHHDAMERRAELWSENLNSMETIAPVTDVDVSFGGCGWSLGETVRFTATHPERDETNRIVMCRSRDGTMDMRIEK